MLNKIALFLSLFLSISIGPSVFSQALHTNDSTILEGLWERACEFDGSIEACRSVKFAGPDLEYSISRTSNLPNDLVLRFTMTWLASFELDKATPVGVNGLGLPNDLKGLHEIDFTLNEIVLVPHDEVTARFFEEKEYCGLSGWKSGEALAVSGRVCGGNQLAPKGFTAYNTLTIWDDQLFIDFDKSSPTKAKRPKATIKDVFRRIN